MSGSPVYLDGRILGAVAFSYSFAKETIGGITPIAQMVDTFQETVDLPDSGAILKKSSLWDYRLAGGGNRERYLEPIETLHGGKTLPEPEILAGHSLVPISTPLSLSGFNSRTLRRFAPRLRAVGLSVMQGSGGTAGRNDETAPADQNPVEPGSNIVVPLIRGDLDVSASGTVTYVDGNKIYAFGHSLLNLGFTELPMHRGRAITIFPSVQSSFKILEIGEAIGSIRQDRGSGIFGVLGRNARMIPLTTRLTTSRGTRSELNFELVRDRYLTPLLIDLALYNALTSSERAAGVTTLQIKGKIRVKGEEAVEIENRFTSDSDALILASHSVAAPVNFMLSAGYRELEMESIDLDLVVQEEDRGAVLDSIRADRMELKAGETLNLEISYRMANGEVRRKSHPVMLPEGIFPGPLTMLVADGTRMMSQDAREQGDELIPRDLSQLIRYINNLRKNDRLYVRFYRQEPGAVVRGENLPGLPPSIISIMKSARNSGGAIHTRILPIREYELPATEYVVAGSESLTLTIVP
jgi:hypothetical protein